MPPELERVEDLFSLSGIDLLTPAQEARARAEWDDDATVDVLIGNIRSVAAERGTIRPMNRIQAIYGPALGIADATRLSQGLRALVSDGTLALVANHKRPLQCTFRYVRQPADALTR